MKETNSNILSGEIKYDTKILNHLKEILPHAKFALTTNGQEIPKGDWLQYIDRLRVSIDTSSAELFNKIKGGEL